MKTFEEKQHAWKEIAKIKDRGLEIPERCEKCKKKSNPLQAHHEDYNKPTEVIFLCKHCHMKLHHGKDVRSDNTTLSRKVFLRKKTLSKIENPIVMETHGGSGQVFENCYKGFEDGVVFEKNPKKIDFIAKQRPNWLVYHCDSLIGIDSGAGSCFDINFLDIDPYGSPWKFIKKFFESDKYNFQDKMALVVNDGLRQKLKMTGPWTIKDLQEEIEEYGNAEMYEVYLDVCKERVKKISSQKGYGLTQWAGYYVGNSTHYAAILER